MSSCDCIFCKIVAGDITSTKVYEDEHVLAFLDITQVTEGHTLVIPKAHKKDVFELDATTAAHLFSVVPEISRGIKVALNPIGLNVVNNNGEAAGQSVFHYHMHLIPRYGKGDGFGAVWKSNQSQYDAEKLNAIADKIKLSI